MNELIKQLAETAYRDVVCNHTIGDAVSREAVDQRFAELIIRQCGYYADIFESLGCPADMDPTEAKPSDFIKKQLGVEA
jgi:hypothetical protein